MTGQQLKNSILQMAVQGKLVPQDPNDEPASVLLERIRAEKDALMKAGKIKKEKKPSVIFRGADNLPYEKIGNNEPVCIADEVPFDIPDSWEWVRFCNVVNYSMGKTPPRKESIYWNKPVHSWVSIADMVTDGHIITTKEAVNDYAADVSFKGRKSPAGTLLMSFKLTVGKVSILDIDAFHNEAIISIYPFVDDDKIMTSYLFTVMPLLSQLGETKTAIKGNTLNSESLDSLWIPLPPLNEQARICKKIKELIPVLNNYTDTEKEAEHLNKCFPEQLKKSILQEAVQGKLVPQDENDEPASVLLERIRAEKKRLIKEGKIKKGKNESIIFRRDKSYYEKLNGVERCIDDEIPFEIPENWCWCRLGNLVKYQNGYAYKSSDMNNLNQGYPVIKSGNLMSLEVVLKTMNDYVKIPNEKMLESSITKGDMLMCLSSQSDNPEPLGKTAIYKFDTPALLNQRVLKMRPFHEEITLYLYYVINSEYFHYTVSHQGGGSAQANLKLDHVLGMLIPLPPLAEQHRIVSQIVEIMPFIDNLTQ